MSGETVELRGGERGELAGLLQAASLVVEHARARVAVVGGLAVTCRLATAHRATADVDVVAGEPEVLAQGHSVAQNLIDAGVALPDPGKTKTRVHVFGTKVEIIETEPLHLATAGAIEPASDRLFVLSHRWALETATPCTIRVRGTSIATEVPVATAPSLVAMKLHAIQDRKDDRKRASDAWDLYRLLEAHLWRGALVGAFDDAPGDCLQLVVESLQRVFRSEVTRTRRWLVAYGDPTWSAQATEEDLGRIADGFLDAVRLSADPDRRRPE